VSTENTGRISRTLAPEAQAILFGTATEKVLDEQLRPITEVDEAHLIMLSERGLIRRQEAGRLLRSIRELRAGDFQPLRGRPAPRGIYLLYENHLIEVLGLETGGGCPYEGDFDGTLDASSWL
jgi:argininosuccinate lyase